MTDRKFSRDLSRAIVSGPRIVIILLVVVIIVILAL
jgi:hypothetical protein